MNDGAHAVLARYPYLAAYTEMTASDYTATLPFGAEFRDAVAHFIAGRVLEGHPDVATVSQSHYALAERGMLDHRPDSTSHLVALVNAAIQDLIARRPNILLLTDGTRTTFTELTTGTYASQTLPVDETYREGLAHYVAARVYELGPQDEKATVMAKLHRQLYLAQT
jgi:hypothetical protein